MDIKDRIKDLCKEKKITVAAMERALGFSNGFVSTIKAESIQHSRLMAIAEYLDTTPEFLLTGEKSGYYYNEETAKVAQELYDDPHLRILFDAARNSDPKDLLMAADLLKRLKETNGE